MRGRGETRTCEDGVEVDSHIEWEAWRLPTPVEVHEVEDGISMCSSEDDEDDEVVDCNAFIDCNACNACTVCSGVPDKGCAHFEHFEDVDGQEVRRENVANMGDEALCLSDDEEEDEAEWESEEEIKIQAKVKTASGEMMATLDTAASNLWLDLDTFAKCRGRGFVTSVTGASGADGSSLEVVGRGFVTFSWWGRTFKDVPCRVMRKMPGKFLIGRRMMLKLGVLLDLQSGKGSFRIMTAKSVPLVFSGRVVHTPVSAVHEGLAAVREADVPDMIASMDLCEFGTEEEQEKLRGLLLEYADLFSEQTATIPGFEFGLDLTEDADLTKLNRPSFPKSRTERELEAQKVRDLVNRGILVPSSGSFATNNVMVPKKTNADGSAGGMRVTSDFRVLNSMTKDISYPTEDVKRIVRWLATKRVYSVVDLRDGYFNIKLREQDCHLTSIRTVLGQFQYAVMAQGLKGACAYFQSVVNKVYDGLRLADGMEVSNVCAIMAAYLDDLGIGSETAADHLRDLRQVFERTRAAGLRFKLAKCLFGKRSVEILGHQVANGSIRPSNDHLAVFSRFREPRNAADLLRFIGLVGFFGEHVEGAADRLAPLYEVLVGTGWNKKKPKRRKVVVSDWEQRWGERQRLAFEALRELMSRPEFLVAPRPSAPKKLVCDASDYGLGAVLLQLEGDRGWLPVAFASRKQKGAEARYTVSEKECLAVLFGLCKFREHLYGEEFGVVTDHAALQWLMSLRDPKRRLARWIVEFQAFAFTVEHAPGNGTLMAVPDALSRDTMDRDMQLCARCLEAVADISAESSSWGFDKVDLQKKQEEEFGAPGKIVDDKGLYAFGEDGFLYRVFSENDVRLAVPASMKERVLEWVHGSREVGHWGVLRTAARLKQRYWWKGWFADVEKRVRECVACRLAKMTRSRRQARMQVWHPRARFHTVAVDVLEVSPKSADGNRKVIVMGDLFTRFMVAVPVAEEKAEVVAGVLFDRWISIFGPPVRILSDRGKPFVSGVVRSLCARIGTKKVFTTPYAPQTDGMVERFNATLTGDLAKFVLDEADWDKHVSFATFRYNSSVNSATGMSPYFAMFGVRPFEFDSCQGLSLRLEDEPADVAARLAEVHAQLFNASLKSREWAQKHYDKAVEECQFELGERVLLYHPPGEKESGRKLRVPWLGPYLVQEKHSSCGYTVRSELDGRLARVHVNRLKRVPSGRDVDAEQPQQGLWPDVRRVLRGVLDRRTRSGAAVNGSDQQGVEYKVRKAGRRGFVWVPRESLPDVVVRAYELSLRG